MSVWYIQLFLVLMWLSAHDLLGKTSQERCSNFICGYGTHCIIHGSCICNSGDQFGNLKTLRVGNDTIKYCLRRCIGGSCPPLTTCETSFKIHQCVCPVQFREISPTGVCADFAPCIQYICGKNHACTTIVESHKCTNSLDSSTPSKTDKSNSPAGILRTTISTGSTATENETDAGIPRTTISTGSTTTENETDEPVWQTWVGAGAGVLGAITIGLLVTGVCLIRRKGNRKENDSVATMRDGEKSGGRDIRSRHDYDSMHYNGVVGPFLTPNINTEGAAIFKVNQTVRKNGYDHVVSLGEPSQTRDPAGVWSKERPGESLDQTEALAIQTPPMISTGGSSAGYEQVDIVAPSSNNARASNQPTIDGIEADLEESWGYSNHLITDNKLKQKVTISVSQGPSDMEIMASNVKTDNSVNNYSTLYELDKQGGSTSPRMVHIDTPYTTGEDTKYDRVHLPNVSNSE